MTEEQWLTSTDPDAMLAFLRREEKFTERKARLFAAGFIRSWHTPHPQDRVLAAVEVAERHADGRADLAELGQTGRGLFAEMPYAARVLCHRFPGLAVEVALHDGQEHWEVQSHLFRCIFGNPFRPLPPLAPSILAWNDGCIPKLATQIYEERAFDRVGVLADALEEAGSGDPALLEHLRGPGPHCRGCHVLDLILGRE